MAPKSQQHYLEMLGVARGATMDEIHTAYYLHIENYSLNPTEHDAEEQYKLRHAYNVLCRQYGDGEAAPPVRDVDTDRRGRTMLVTLDP